MHESVIIAQNINFNYGKTHILKNLSLSIKVGEIYGIIGPSGSGKTTLIKTILGSLKLNSGKLNVFGQKVISKELIRIGYMPQLPALYEDLTVYQNIDFFARMYETKKRIESIHSLLEQVKLLDYKNQVIGKLSSGQRQRVSLAIALIHSPPLLLLDEPTVGLDPKLRFELWQYFEKLSGDGTSILISSHNMDDANHCQKIGFLYDGSIVTEGSPEELSKSIDNKKMTLEEVFLHIVSNR
jgi:ABC-2 type transport system ATP-binding protein